jgi:hypothetical protein
LWEQVSLLIIVYSFAPIRYADVADEVGKGKGWSPEQVQA